MRFLLTLLLILALFPLLRALLRGAAHLFTSSPADHAAPTAVPSQGQLKRDPVCGTYVSTASPYTAVSGGQTAYFCSPGCRDQFNG